VLVLTRRAAHEIQFGGSSNISSSINDRASSPRKTAAVLVFASPKVSCMIINIVLLQKIGILVQTKYRGATKDGIAVKS